jgi:hypothetical protein
MQQNLGLVWTLRILLLTIYLPFIVGGFVLYFLPWFVFRILGCWAFTNAFIARVTIKQVMKEAGY